MRHSQGTAKDSPGAVHNDLILPESIEAEARNHPFTVPSGRFVPPFCGEG
jgi:hypothetical protein